MELVNNSVLTLDTQEGIIVNQPLNFESADEFTQRRLSELERDNYMRQGFTEEDYNDMKNYEHEGYYSNGYCSD